MAGFVYNPAESIKQDFQQAGSGLGNIFAQVIQQQQRDYNLAENTFANIEALKKDLNMYGQKSITSKANTLLGNASQAILANGKLDYSKLGEIRQAVSDIKDLKTGYDLGAKEYERMLQMGLANKENLTSFEGFYKDLSAKMSDENLIKNPRDLQAALADTYTKSLDATKMFGKSYLAANPYQKFSQEVKDAKGNMVRVQGELPAGWTIDANGNKIPPKPVTIQNPDGTTSTVDYADQALMQIRASNPDALVAMRRQAGFAGENMSDKQLVEFYTSKIPMAAQVQQIKSAEELSIQASQATTAASAAKVADELNRLNLQGKKLSNTGQALQNQGQSIENQANRMSLDALKAEGAGAGGDDEVFFTTPKSIVMPIGKGSTDVMGKSQKVSYDAKSGQIFVSALKSKNSGFNVGEETADVAGVENVAIPRNKLASFKKSLLASALVGADKNQKPLIKRQIDNIFKKAQFGSVSDNLLNKLTLPNKLKTGEKFITLSDLRELYSQGKYNSIDEAIQSATNQGLKVTRQ
jgi:hypothetical protein